ncbi:MAG: metallopeptidase family protein [Chloroflexota bacterium]
MRIDEETFREFVVQALDALPAVFVAHLDNVEVVVEDWPDAYVLRQAGAASPADVLGFYHGVPQTNRTLGYNLVPPDKISLYRRPMEMRCRSLDDLRRLVSHVLRHEIAHHFGIDDQRLREIGAY